MSPIEPPEHADCPLCGLAPSRTWLDDGRPTRYVRCCTCRTVYASPRAARASRWASLATEYLDGDFARRNAASRQAALREEARILRGYVGGGAVLDVGCDLGHLFEHFRGSQWRRLGVELSPSAARAAAASYDADVRVGDLRAAAFAVGTVDLVTMLDMFYFLDDPSGELAEVARILRVGGRLAVEFPGQRWMLARIRGPLCWLCERRWCRLRTDSSYLNWYTPKALRALLEGAGLVVEGIHVVGSPAGQSKTRDALGRLHRGLVERLVRRLPGLVTWAPKYLVVATRRA